MLHLDRVADDLERFVPEVLHATHAPGLSVAIATLDGSVWQAGFGFADVETRRPMTVTTLTRGGSMSKAYTAVALLQLAERGLIDLDAPVNGLCDDVTVENPHGQRAVTAYDLLTFRSGLARDVTSARTAPPEPLAKHLACALAEPRIQEYAGAVPRWTTRVGARQQYSNLGIAILGHIVEQRNPDGLDFSEYIRQSVCLPLRQWSTHLPRVPDANILREQTSTGYAGFGELQVPSPVLYPASYPASGLFTTPAEHLRLLLALARGGELDGERLLGPATVQRMLTPQTPLGSDDGPWWGLGLILQPSRDGRQRYGIPGGQVWGWWNDSLVDPAAGYAIVVAVNRFDMLEWHTPWHETAAHLVLDFVAASAESTHGGHAPPPRPVEWRAAYLAGLLTAERVSDFLGAGAAAPPPGPQGYREGYEDMLATTPTSGAVSARLAAGELALDPRDLPLLHRVLGGRGPVPIPLDIWE
jgi:CubicO group peptidase (beta-lactamase class C family)